MTKNIGGEMPSSKQLDRHPRVLEYDSIGMDEGERMITIIEGFAFRDAAGNPGDDPDSRSAQHSISVGSVAEALAELRGAQRCYCGRCVKS